MTAYTIEQTKSGRIMRNLIRGIAINKVYTFSPEMKTYRRFQRNYAESEILSFLEERYR